MASGADLRCRSAGVVLIAASAPARAMRRLTLPGKCRQRDVAAHQLTDIAASAPAKTAAHLPPSVDSGSNGQGDVAVDSVPSVAVARAV